MSDYYTLSGPSVYYEMTDTGSITTTSSTDAQMASMTVTPQAGTYLVMFSSSVNTNNAGSTATISMYVAGTQITHTIRSSSVFDGGALSAANATGGVAIQHIATVGGTDTIQIDWKVSAGTATCQYRTLSLVKIA